MQAIVLAAGEGSRMRPLTANRPKVMLPVAGKPIIEHIITRATQCGVDRFVIVVGYGAGLVRSHLGDGSRFGVRINYVFQEKQLGTAHALLEAQELADDRFVVLNGDVLPDMNSLNALVLSGETSVAAMQVSDPSRYGVFLLEGGNVRSVVEKSPSPPTNLANAGIYLFPNKIFEALSGIKLSQRGEYELTDGINILASIEKIRVMQLKSWIEIGSPWDILAANEVLLQEMETHVIGEIEPGATLRGNVSIGENTIVRNGSYIIGPVIIGEGCDIGPNCYIRPSTCVGDNAKIGNAVEVKNSTIMEGTKIGHLSYVGDSVIGSNCNFGAGTITANLRHDKAFIKSYVKGYRVDSGRKKLGTIMGDDVKTGINTTIYPGTVIESGYWGRPGVVLRDLLGSADNRS